MNQYSILTTCLTVAAILMTPSQCKPTGSLLVLTDKSLMFLALKRFLVAPFVVGKRSVSDQRRAPSSPTTTPEQYLAMAASMDSDFCLPVAICSAMARSRLSSAANSRSRFDDLVVQTFERKLSAQNGYPAVDGSGSLQSPLNMYLEAARFGRRIGVPDACRQVSPTCKFTVEELRLLTISVL